MHHHHHHRHGPMEVASMYLSLSLCLHVDAIFIKVGCCVLGIAEYFVAPYERAVVVVLGCPIHDS